MNEYLYDLVLESLSDYVLNEEIDLEDAEEISEAAYDYLLGDEDEYMESDYDDDDYDYDEYDEFDEGMHAYQDTWDRKEGRKWQRDMRKASTLDAIKKQRQAKAKDKKDKAERDAIHGEVRAQYDDAKANGTLDDIRRQHNSNKVFAALQKESERRVNDKAKKQSSLGGKRDEVTGLVPYRKGEVASKERQVPAEVRKQISTALDVRGNAKNTAGIGKKLAVGAAIGAAAGGAAYGAKKLIDYKKKEAATLSSFMEMSPKQLKKALAAAESDGDKKAVRLINAALKAKEKTA